MKSMASAPLMLALIVVFVSACCLWPGSAAGEALQDARATVDASNDSTTIPPASQIVDKEGTSGPSRTA